MKVLGSNPILFWFLDLWPIDERRWTVTRHEFIISRKITILFPFSARCHRCRPQQKICFFPYQRHLSPSTSCVMATPTLLQIDDHNPLVFYSPNSSWTRGGNIADFDGTSTFTTTTGASATLTFTGMHFIPPIVFFFRVLYLIHRTKAQGLAFGAQSNSWHLIRRHMCCRLIVSMVDLRRPSTLRKNQDSNSSKNYFNLLRYPTRPHILLLCLWSTMVAFSSIIS